MLNSTGVKAKKTQDAVRGGVKAKEMGRIYAFRRAVVALLAVVLMWCGWQVVSAGRANAAQTATPVVTYTVSPGDTLWSYAQEITPAGQNVGDTVDLLMSINNLDSAQLELGQRILVPRQG